MACRRHIAVILATCLLSQAFALPAKTIRWQRDNFDNELGDYNDKMSDLTTSTTTSSVTIDPFDDDDDDDFGESMDSAPTTGGSSIFSLLRLAGALFPSSGGTNNVSRISCLHNNIIVIRPKSDRYAILCMCE
ncbi:unnamed protein product [Diatraea saccharalis]|uniref:Uncharacterized protein n=1 Tax=Diatraea saccharalis TaxID=40085 RepID=A0A9N9WGY2_9NEOP|nr:unnamed protein product [Diatraea saccharalis]